MMTEQTKPMSDEQIVESLRSEHSSMVNDWSLGDVITAIRLARESERLAREPQPAAPEAKPFDTERVIQAIRSLVVDTDGDDWKHNEKRIREILKEAQGTPTPPAHIGCMDCGLPYSLFGMDLIMPRAQWIEIHPQEDGVLCANCMMQRASKVKGATCVHAIIEIFSS